MTPIVKIDGHAIDVDEFLRNLKLSGKYDGLVEQLVTDRLTVLAARKQGIKVSEQEVQERADQFRRVRSLHRTSDTNKYLDALRVSLDEFEAFITDSLYQEKMLQKVCDDSAVQGYFKLNSPRFDSIEVSHIVLDAEGKAKEMIAVLRDDPGSFVEMAREHSIADSRERAGSLGKVRRGSLRSDVEAKLFNAAVGDLLGPFAAADRTAFEIFRLDAKHPARLDDDTAAELRRLLRDAWLQAQAQEHRVEAG
jgi:parvulin-like peptidyl-prolyl isomerase